MKLKKIASLMLAGIMAVSMLAGCAEGGKKEEDKEPVISGLTGKVVAALDEDTTKAVTFTSSSNLDNVVAKYLQIKGTNGVSKLSATELNKIDDEISKEVTFTWPDSETNKDSAKNASKEAKVTVVIPNSTVSAGASEDYAVKKIAEAIDEAVENLDLAEDTVIFKVDMDGDGETEQFWYDYSYAGNLSVTEVKDVETGAVSYVAVFTVTRTAAQQNK